MTRKLRRVSCTHGLIAVVVMLALVACGGAISPAAPTAAPATKAPAPTAAAAPTAASAAPTVASAAAPTAAAQGATTPAAASAGPAITWKFAGHLAATHDGTKAMNEFADKVKAATNGRLQITVFPAEQLYKSADLDTSVTSGLVDAVSVADTYLGSTRPAFALNAQPFGVPTYELAQRTLLAGTELRKYLDGVAQKTNTQLIGLTPTGLVGIAGTKPIRKAEDIKGLRVRTSGPSDTKAVQLIGGVPVSMSSGDVPQAMQRGLVELTVATPGTTVAQKYWDVGAKYFTRVGFWLAANYWFVNKASWDKLPADIQQIVTQQAAAVEKAVWQTAAGAEANAAKAMQDAGVEVSDLPESELAKWRTAVRPIYDEFAAKSPDAAKALELLDKAR